MATITARKRGDGTLAYTAQIRLKKQGKIVHTEAQTFDRKAAAEAWAKKRETELAAPGAIERSKSGDPALSVAIQRYIDESKKEIGRTKAQVLRTIKAHSIAEMRCSEIKSADIVAFAQGLDVSPATRSNYLSHLGAIFAVARPAWHYPLDQQAMRDAFVVAKRMGVTGKSRERTRRPTLAELDKLLNHFSLRSIRRPDSAPMVKVIVFAIFSTRRQEEITRIAWNDLEEGRVLVRDMKNPGEKVGNDTYVDLVPEAMKVIQSMPKTDKAIFPYSTDAISAAFTRACLLLGINTEEMPDEERLHFHDLRHEGVSRLFEMGWNIPHVAAVSGHRDWKSLKRYTHLRQTGDKYKGWAWLEKAVARPSGPNVVDLVKGGANPSRVA